jgi:tRNA pseudouridine55 synthase
MTTTSGLLLLDKPAGMTSHDVVARVRKALNEKRVGHAGTLDPMATGLLILGVGSETRLLRFAQAETKVYSGLVTLGVATDSLDADGEVVGEMPVPSLDPSAMQAVADEMVGTQEQVPPMVSAIKVGGRRLHSLARAGVEVERVPRTIDIIEFTVRPTENPSVWSFVVRCSVGTYVRVLLSDFATRIGTVGHLSALRREKSGSHDVSEALTLEELNSRCEAGEDVLLPSSEFVRDLSRATLSTEQETAMRHGQRVSLVEVFEDEEIAAFDTNGHLIGILRSRGDLWKPELVFPKSEVSEK